jgi:hypothetical protein
VENEWEVVNKLNGEREREQGRSLEIVALKNLKENKFRGFTVKIDLKWVKQANRH